MRTTIVDDGGAGGTARCHRQWTTTVTRSLSLSTPPSKRRRVLKIWGRGHWTLEVGAEQGEKKRRAGPCVLQRPWWTWHHYAW